MRAVTMRAGRNPGLQLSIDATAMQQAGIGANYIKNISNDRIATFMRRTDQSAPDLPIPLRLGATVGTASARRQALLTAARPDLGIGLLRGNVPTRLSAVRTGRFDDWK